MMTFAVSTPFPIRRTRTSRLRREGGRPILDGFGPTRLYWGSDYPCSLDAVCSVGPLPRLQIVEGNGLTGAGAL